MELTYLSFMYRHPPSQTYRYLMPNSLNPSLGIIHRNAHLGYQSPDHPIYPLLTTACHLRSIGGTDLRLRRYWHVYRRDEVYYRPKDFIGYVTGRSSFGDVDTLREGFGQCEKRGDQAGRAIDQDIILLCQSKST